MSPRPLVGFDLDMTLIDSRPGIGAVYTALAAETGTSIDVDVVTSRLGPPLEQELAHWFPAADVPAAADRYRALYPGLAPALCAPMPGALEAVAAARAAGWSTLVLTAKHEPNARLHLDALGLAVDDLVGEAWRLQKADVLRARGARVYVGDHAHDMEAARAADVVGIGVATGPCSADELASAGADHVLADLTTLPALLETLRAA